MIGFAIRKVHFDKPDALNEADEVVEHSSWQRGCYVKGIRDV